MEDEEDDICPYVFCPKCKSRNSWVRYKARDVIRERDGEVMWKGWYCKHCGEVTLEPSRIVKANLEEKVV